MLVRPAKASGVRHALGPGIGSSTGAGAAVALPHPNPKDNGIGVCCTGRPALNGMGGGGGVAISRLVCTPVRHAILDAVTVFC